MGREEAGCGLGRLEPIDAATSREEISLTTEEDHPDTLDGSFVPRLRDEVALVHVGDQGLLYVEESGLLHRLDRIGAIVCGCFDGRASVDVVAEELAEAFQDDRGVVEAHVITFVRELGRLGLLDNVATENPTGPRGTSANRR